MYVNMQHSKYKFYQTNGSHERAPKDRSHIRCLNCQTEGNYANTCPLPKREGGTGPGVTVKTAAPASTGEEIQNEEFEEIRKVDYDEWDNFVFL
jgi:hypothetical protein